MTKLGDLMEEIDWLEEKIARDHPLGEVVDLKQKLVDAYVEKKRITGERLNTKGSIYERTADMKVVLEDYGKDNH